MKTLLIMAGGTGGHIMPGLAVAYAIKQLGWRVVWLGHPEGMEARLVPQHGIDLAGIRFAALRGKGWLRKLLLPLNLLLAFVAAWRALGKIRPQVALGLGGYISFPGGMMASLRGIPLVLHEQNAVAGLANRVLARVADRVLLGFPGALRNAEHVGNPVRREIAALPVPNVRYAARQGTLNVLVVGGSLGAAALNEIVPQALALMPTPQRPQVIHQAGAKHLAALKAAYQRAGVTAECVAFIDDMASAYANADLVVCRAGALTVAELAVAGVASVLVPFPFAVDDHQTVNARYLADQNAACLIAQAELTPSALAAVFNMPRERLLNLAVAARALARTDAAEQVARACVEASGL